MGIEEGCLGSSGRMLEPKWGKKSIHSHGALKPDWGEGNVCPGDGRAMSIFNAQILVSKYYF